MSTKKNMPLACALCEHRLRDVVEVLNGSVVLMTNCTGRPCEPGSDGNWKAATRAPAMLFHLLLQLLLQLRRALRLRSLPGLEQHAADALVDRRHAGDLEHLVVLGQLLAISNTCFGVDVHLLRRSRSAGR